MTTPADDEFTELRDADIPRVDLVDKAANGLPFLIAKRDGNAGLMEPDFVRDLIGKEASPDTEAGETVTMTGSPAAIAKLIHEAAVRRASADSPQDREVSKVVGGELDEAGDGMDPTVVLAAPDDAAPGDASEPGSPAWEAIDAATAQKWTSIAVRLRNALSVMAERELIEAAAADPSDAEAAWDLQDAQCAIDYVIGVLAAFAVDEQAEADFATEALDAVGKALAGFDTTPLDTFEALATVTKAGRVLSAANERAIREAVASLQKVLASLPAPVPDTPTLGGLPVAKNEETDMQSTDTEPVTKTDTTATADETALEETTVPETVGKAAEEVAKADGDSDGDGDGEGEKAPQLAVYDAKGKLVGIVDPSALTPVTGVDGDDDEADDAGDTAPPPAEHAPAGHAPAPQSPDLAPAPAAEVGTPSGAAHSGDDVTKQTDTPEPATTDDQDDTTTSDALLKSSITEAVRAGIADYSATQEQAFAKQAADLAQMAEVIDALKGRVDTLEEQPATPKVFTQGAVPPRDMMRGQDRGAAPMDVAQAQQMKKGLYGAADATEQNRIATDMQTLAIAQLREIHQQRG